MAISERVRQLLEWPLVIEKLKSHIKTPGGAAFVENLEVLEENSIRKRMKKISSLKELFQKREYPDFSGMENISGSLERAVKGSVLGLEELTEIRNCVLCSLRIKSFLKERVDEHPPLEEEYESLDNLEEISRILKESITENGDINRKKYPELKKISDEIHRAKMDAEKQLKKLISSYSRSKALQEDIYTTQNQRYVLMVKTGMKHMVRGTVNDMSSSGATAYMEPNEVRNTNNRIISLEIEYREAIYRILCSLTEQVSAFSAEIGNNAAIISRLDFLSAAAKFSIGIKGNEPRITGDPLMSLKDARHPLLSLMNPEGTVANDIDIGGDFNCIIISGANTGGKTVLLKTLGLTVLMVLHGLHISADSSSTAGIFTAVLADIGDDQNLDQSLSTFSGQIVELARMLNEADEKTLVLIDEIIAGTNPAQGAALARGFMEELADTGCRAAVTTHYTELKEVAASDNRFINGSVSFDLDTYKPTYRYTPGVPGISYAVEIAGDYGMPEAVIKRSRELLDERELSTEGILEDLQKIRQEHEEEREKINRENKRLEEISEKLAEREAGIKAKAEELKLEKGLEFLRELNGFRETVSRRISEIRQEGVKEAGELQKEIIDLQKNIKERVEDISRQKHRSSYRPLDREHAVPGVKVFVPLLEKTGTLESVDGSGETALVHLGGSVRSRFRIDRLMYDPSVQETKRPGKGKPGHKVQTEGGEGKIGSVIQTRYNTIDLRGKTVDESLLLLESGFDGMMRNGIDTVVVIHGHGTGALRDAVRSSLGNSLYAEDYRPGEQGEGGDGVTIVRLRV